MDTQRGPRRLSIYRNNNETNQQPKKMQMSPNNRVVVTPKLWPLLSFARCGICSRWQFKFCAFLPKIYGKLAFNQLAPAAKLAYSPKLSCRISAFVVVVVVALLHYFFLPFSICFGFYFRHIVCVVFVSQILIYCNNYKFSILMPIYILLFILLKHLKMEIQNDVN